MSKYLNLHTITIVVAVLLVVKFRAKIPVVGALLDKVIA